MKRFTFCIIMIACVNGYSLAAHAQTGTVDSLTVDQVVRDVLRNNDRIRAAAFMEEAARREADAVTGWDDPMLMLGVENVPTSFAFDEDMMTMKVVGLSQKLPATRRAGLEADAKRAAADAVREDRRQMILDMVAEAKMAYVELLYRQRQLAALEMQKGLAKQIAQSAITQSAEEANMSHAEAWRLDAETMAMQIEASSALYELDALRGMTSSADLPRVSSNRVDTTPASLEPWMDSARANYAPLKRLRKQSEQYRYSSAAAGRMALPMIELYAEYGFRDELADEHLEPGGDDMISFGARISLPFASRGKARAMAQSMTAMQKRVEAEAAQLEKDVEAELRSLHHRAVRLDRSIVTYRERIIPANEEAYRSGLAAYRSGTRSLSEALSRAKMIYDDRMQLNELQLELAKTLIEAERYTANADEYLLGVAQ